jgi:hypothetical protein
MRNTELLRSTVNKMSRRDFISAAKYFSILAVVGTVPNSCNGPTDGNGSVAEEVKIVVPSDSATYQYVDKNGSPVGTPFPVAKTLNQPGWENGAPEFDIDSDGSPMKKVQ